MRRRGLDGDTLLEYGEDWKVVIHVDQIYGGAANVKLQPNDVVTIEIKPSTGSILKVERMLPPAIDYVMDLVLTLSQSSSQPPSLFMSKLK